MKKVKKSTLVPLLLLIYLAVMSYIGYSGMKSGAFSPMFYWAVIGGTLLCILGVHLSMRHREKMRDKDNESGK